MHQRVNRAIRLSAWLLSLVLLAVLCTGCTKEEKETHADLGLITAGNHDTAPAKAEETTDSTDEKAEETTEDGEEDEKEEETQSPASEEEPPAEEPVPPEMRPLTDEELAGVQDMLSYDEIGFFLCAYDRPEEIAWDEVFYCGAGISVTPSDEELADYEHWNGEIFAQLETIRYEDVLTFVQEKTGTDYRAARRPLNWYYSDDYGVFMFDHGDTNFQPVTFTGGETDGTNYRLYYSLDDWANFTPDRPFIMTASIRDGRWTYSSNLPADSTPPVTLLTVEFFADREEMEQQNPVHTTDIRRLPSDEDSPWYWAVITAQEDDVRVLLDRDPMNGEMYFMSSVWFNVPAENLDSYVLQKGEKAAFRVNLPWYPCIRLAASWGAYWGEYWFGSDNWLYLEDEDGLPLGHWITGHDYDGEGRGCGYQDEVQLVQFLDLAPWVYYTDDGDGVTAVVNFRDYSCVDVENDFELYSIFMNFEHDENAPDEAPDLLRMRKAYDEDLVWETVPLDGTFLGSYHIEAYQMDGEQILTLTEAEGGDGGSGALSYLFPDYDETVHSFTLHRYLGCDPNLGQ